MKLIQGIFILFFVVACTTLSKDSGTETAPLGVAIQNEKPKVHEPIEVVETKNENQVGPQVLDDERSDQAKTIAIEPAIALLLPDNEDIIPVTLAIMRDLLKSGIIPRIYAGAGLGASIATALAFNMSADEIEWELFALEREGAHGQKEKAKALLDRFREQDLSQSFHVLVLPTSKGKWLTRGKIEEVTKSHLDSIGQGSWPVRIPSDNFGADVVLKIKSEDPKKQVINLKDRIQAWIEFKKSTLGNGR